MRFVSSSRASSNYTQRLGSDLYTLLIEDGARMIAIHNGERVFSCTPVGIRVVTSLMNGRVLGLVGIATTAVEVILTTYNSVASPSNHANLANISAQTIQIQKHVKPNEEWQLASAAGGDGRLVRAAPYVPPFE